MRNVTVVEDPQFVSFGRRLHRLQGEPFVKAVVLEKILPPKSVGGDLDGKVVVVGQPMPLITSLAGAVKYDSRYLNFSMRGKVVFEWMLESYWSRNPCQSRRSP